MTGAAGWTTATNVLAVRLDGMGDVLMTTPALRALRESRPGRRLTLLTSPAGAEVARHVPGVDDVIIYRAPWMKPSAAGADDSGMIELLRGASFDAAVIFTVYSQSPLPAALFLHLAGVPRALAHCRENPYSLLSDWVREREPDIAIRHEVQRQLDLVSHVGCFTADGRLSFLPPAPAIASAREKLRHVGVELETPFIVIHPGGTAPSRRYPVHRFAETVWRLRADHGLPVVLTGDGDEAPLVESVAERSGVAVACLAGALDVAELGATLGMAGVLLSGNTGPVHLAAAMGTPVVDLYALTNPQHKPWGVPNRVLSSDVECGYCYRSICLRETNDCIASIPPAVVVDAVLELLDERNGPAHAGVPKVLPLYGGKGVVV